MVLRKKAWYSHYDIFIPLSLIILFQFSEICNKFRRIHRIWRLEPGCQHCSQHARLFPLLKRKKWLFNPSYIVRFLVERPPQILFLLSVFDLFKIRLRHTKKRSFFVIPCTFCNGYTHLPVLGCNVSKRRLFARSKAF